MMSAKYLEYYNIILRGAVFSWTRCKMSACTRQGGHKQDKNIMSASATQGGHKEIEEIKQRLVYYSI